MASDSRQIIAIGGGGFYRDSENLALERYLIAQTNAQQPRVLFVPTASGEPDVYIASFYAAFLKLDCRPTVLTLFKRTPEIHSLLLNQDLIYVGGGNTKSMLALWREWGMVESLREAWQTGIVLAGVSAGAICWFEQGLTDSFAGELRALPGLAFLPGSCCPHYDSEAQRRPAYHRLIASGEAAPGIALEDWTAVHFQGSERRRIVTARAGARAYSLRSAYGSIQEVVLPVEELA